MRTASANQDLDAPIARLGNAFAGGHGQLAPGELLCLMTDGVTEAQNPTGVLYGHARADQVIGRLVRGDASVRELVIALEADVLAFEDGAEANDDLTILALRWNGPCPPATALPSRAIGAARSWFAEDGRMTC